MAETIELLSSSPVAATEVRTPVKKSSRNYADHIVLLSSSSPLVSPSALINGAKASKTGPLSPFFATTPMKKSSFTSASQLLREEKEKEKEKENARGSTTEDNTPSGSVKKASSAVKKTTKGGKTTTTTKKGKKGSSSDDATKNAKLTGKITKPRSRASSPKLKKKSIDDSAADIFDFPVSQSSQDAANKKDELSVEEVEPKSALKKAARAKKATTAKPMKPMKPAKKLDITTLDMYEVPLPPSSPLPVAAPAPEPVPATEDLPKPSEGGKVAKAPSTPPESPTRRQRKRSWTPVEDTVRNEVVDLSSDTPEAKKPGFESMVDGFKHAPEDSSNLALLGDAMQEPMMKKRCLELVGVPTMMKTSRKALEVTQEETSAPKGKRGKGKKRVTTITELATRQFRKEVDDDASSSSLYGFFATQMDTQGGDDENAPIDVALPKPKPKKKPATKSRKSKKEGTPPPALLTPKAAQKAAQEQHLIFGTSSQLVQSQSPEGGWDLEIKKGVTIRKGAVADSNGESSLSEDLNEEPIGTQTLTLSTKAAREKEAQVTYKRRPATSKKGLWQVAGGAFDLTNVEVVDMVDSPVKDSLSAFKFATAPSSKATSRETEKSSKERPSPTSKLENQAAPRTIASVVRANQQQTQPLTDITTNIPPSSQPPPSQKSSTGPKTSAASNKKTTGSKSKSSKKNKEPELPTEADRPNFDGFTQAQLAEQLSKYGYKPIKSRNTMVKILNTCWDGIIQRANAERERLKNVVVEDSAGVVQEILDVEIQEEAAPSSSQPAPAKKKGRPAKKAVEQESLEDVIPETTTTTKKSSKSKFKTTATAAVEATPQLSDEEINTIITKAVTSQKPGTDIKKPSFHQRILMYESIVLEDLTDWLVTEGIPAIGEDVDKVLGTNGRSQYERISRVHKWCVKGSIVWVRKDWEGGGNRWK